MASKPALVALCALAVAAAAAPAAAQDLYIGTVDVQKDQVILTRCDLAQNRYVLRDREGEGEADKPVAKLRERLKTLKAPVYAEVIGEYVEVQSEDGNGLDVIGLENVTPAKSCHLLDALPAG
ncbi:MULTISPECIES: hypothetical protein [Caulobacter]|jgi:hypothetical protein|uniref:Uncharacterized protein n=1 Tax=Caulobacter rhizosphaerae TaxID=2010972 RepID=A0ABU1N068_9CAUL|nr:MULTISPECIES: hypothetical protein [Caulobacter]KQZ17809.1 hypothetical protein ASD47_12030 [Caulobacter sp. Root1472]MDR6531812.1 hypothetical protein [Caulobacter rhizosphaerae]